MPPKNRYKLHNTKKKKTNRFDLIILILNILVALLLLLSYLAPSTDPRSFSLIAVLGFVQILLFATNILFAIYWLFRKTKWYSLISVICIIVGYGSLSMHIGFRASTADDYTKSASSIRVMAYNVHGFDGIDIYNDQKITSKMLTLVKDAQPDIVTFEEFYNQNSREADSVKKIINSPYYFFKSYKKTRVSPDTIADAGNAIFSKYPIIDSGSIKSTSLLATKAIFVDLKREKDTIRVYCVHLAAVKMDQNKKVGYLNGNLGSANSSYIESVLTNGFIRRSYQVDKIKANIDSCKYPYIIMGDFNDTPNSYSVNTLGAGLKDAFKEKGSGYVTTYYTLYPLQIDHILASPVFNVLSYKTVNKQLSDHKPIVADLELKQ